MAARYSKYIFAFITIIYIVGMVGISLPQTHALFVSLSVTNILLCIGLLLLFHKPYTTTFAAKAISIAIAGFIVEVVGVKTGKLFGVYHYTPVLGWRLFDVPLLIGLNWFFMVYCSVQLARLFKLPLLPTAILSGLFMVSYDIALEPNAIALNYWQWQYNTVPLQNYIAWFAFGSLFSLFYLYKTKVETNYMAIYLYLLQVIFFSVLLLAA